MIFHPLKNSPEQLRTVFNNPFYYQPDSLCIKAQKLVVAYVEHFFKDFLPEISSGKMFGVLIVENQQKKIGFLAAFSGQISGKDNYDFFVPPVYDYLNDDLGYTFGRLQISEVNLSITQLECSSEYLKLKELVSQTQKQQSQEIESYRLFMKQEKQKRDSLKIDGKNSPELEKESKFQNAEFKRLKRKFEAQLSEIRKELIPIENQLSELKATRKYLSDNLQNYLFYKFTVNSFDGKSGNLRDIFSDYNGSVPPSGAGECCAPKLLQYACLHGYKPISIAEFWYGESPKGEIRQHLNFYPACNSKCRPILEFMLNGLTFEKNPLDDLPKKSLEIVYEDEFMWIVNKPENMLSCPDKKNQPSVLSVMREKYPDNKEIMLCHRLDLATSGLIIVSKSLSFYREIQQLFEKREIKETDFAVLDGYVTRTSGRIALPLIPDLNDRPRQKVDFLHGKPAVTDFQVVDSDERKTYIYFFPLTGRTHQLRVHSAHYLGLKAPILGDELYGRKASRMYLHAEKIEFMHPRLKNIITVEKKADFYNNKISKKFAF